eukprot:scaffold12431_cov57-Attheya_sp.AAC.8
MEGGTFVQESVQEAITMTMIPMSKSTATEEQREKIFANLMLQGKLHQAVRFITERDQAGIMLPNDIDDKSGLPVIDTLCSKHPPERIPEVDDLEDYDTLPEFVRVDITDETVEKVVRRLSGAAGPRGMDATSLQHWLLRFGTSSQRLRNAVADLADWMANETPPWAATRAMLACRLLALNKWPGIRPIGIGEVWQRLTTKVVLEVTVDAAKAMCGDSQLCVGLEAGVEGGIHAMRLIWEEHKMEGEWGSLLVDARNAFNEGNRIIAMLWTVRHIWPSGARFLFNVYRHWSTLIIRGVDGKALGIPSREGVTQGDPIAMMAYGLIMLPFIKQLKREHPNVSQPWYADDAGAGGKFTAIRKQFERLQELGPARGYFPELSKSILVVREANLAAAQVAFKDLGFKITTGSRYLGGFIGEAAPQEEWVRGKTDAWATAVTTIAKVCQHYPQLAYAGLQKSLQQEWQFLQRVTDGISTEFESVKSSLKDDFLPGLLGQSKIGQPLRDLLALPVKHTGIAIPNPTTSAGGNFMASTVVCGHLVAALRERVQFNGVEHKSVIKEGRAAIKINRTVVHDNELSCLLRPLPPEKKRIIERGRRTGAWISVQPSTVNGTELSAEEFRDATHLRYGQVPPNFPTTCNGCSCNNFSVQHALSCKVGGLVISRHDEIKDELGQLAGKVLKPSAIRDEPLINNGRKVECSRSDAPTEADVSTTPPSPVICDNDNLGDLMIRGFWSRGTDCIVDVRSTDLDSKSYQKNSNDKVLAGQEQEKKRKYLAPCPCISNRRHFTPFVSSTDGLIGKEGQTFAKRLAGLLSEKW